MQQRTVKGSPGRAAERRIAPLSRSPIDAGLASILELQHVSGNHAVQRLLTQRQPATVDAPPAAGPLSPPQVAAARHFYTAQPARYTPTIIKQIQTEIGTEPTGRMLDADVQAVARRQEQLNVNASPALKIDGMAGPRTLPQVFKFGLATDKNVTDYTKKASERFKKTSGKSEQQIAKEIFDNEITPKLAASQVPPVKFEIVSNLGTRGAFNNGEWELKLDDLQFQPGDKHNLADTAATMYHESRHAEQDFMIARMLAGQGKSAEFINQKTGQKLDVAQVAHGLPLAPGSMEALIAQGWFDALFPDPAAAERRKNSADLRKFFRERDAARKENREHPSAENAAKQAAAEARYTRAVDEHDQFADEFDAERLESRVRDNF